MTRLLRLAPVFLALLLAGCPSEEGPKDAPPADGGGAETADEGPGAKSAEDCYERMRVAFETQDFATYYDLLTPDSREELLPTMTLLAGMAAGTDEVGMQEYKKILTTHGIEDVDKDPQPNPGGKPPAPMELFKDVKDKRALFNDVMTFAMTRQTEKPIIVGLEGLKVEGDTARGTIVRKVGGKEERDAALFRKVDGRWYADVKTGGK